MSKDLRAGDPSKDKMSFVSYLWLVICQYFSQLKSFLSFNKQGGGSDSSQPSSPTKGLTPQFKTPPGFKAVQEAGDTSTPSGNNSGRQSPGFRGLSPISVPPTPHKSAGVINRINGKPVPFSLSPSGSLSN